MPSTSTRRIGERLKCEIDVDLHLQQRKQRARSVDVSRHGLFVRLEQPPADNRVLFLTLHLPDSAFETMAVVAHRKTANDAGGPGVGFKFFCMSQQAMQRWDSFVRSLGKGAKKPAAHEDAARIGNAVATFFIQLDSVLDMYNFFEHHVARGAIVRVTPPVRELGAEVTILFVHPISHEEFALKAYVEELYADNPLRMGIRFPPLDPAVRRSFLTFLGPSAVAGADGSTGAMPLLAAPRKGWTEYAFFSPRYSAAPAEPEVRTLVASDASLEVLGEVEDEPAAVPEHELPQGTIVDLDPLDAGEVPEDAIDVELVMGQLVDVPELELVDPRELFDFDWQADRRR